MGVFDWFRRGSSVRTETTRDWQVWVEDDAVVVTDRDRDQTFGRALLAGARAVRVVPLTRGTHHASAHGWQVCLARGDGDVLVGAPLPDWQSAHVLAQRICSVSKLPMDEMTEKLFSRVGRVGRI
jgi:hypothetical protein